MKGFHLIFRPENSSPLQYQTADLVAWQGYYDHMAQDQIAHILLKHGFENDEAPLLLKRLLYFCYPNQRARIYRMLFAPLPTTVFAAWRETNLGTEKDLDNSVFWRAVQSLDSCIQSMQAGWLDTFLSDLSSTASSIQHYGYHKKDAIDSNLRRRSGIACLYHPVIVTDAKLWSAGDRELTEVPFARYVRNGVAFDTNKWFDVVSREYIDRYVNDLSEYFARAFKQARCKPWP